MFGPSPAKIDFEINWPRGNDIDSSSFSITPSSRQVDINFDAIYITSLSFAVLIKTLSISPLVLNL